jgi:NAD(P)-dependent dehydrogenase (short-subunit alcohol dehydrogenase family)
VRRFDSCVAVVTGAASGIGHQLAVDLVARGATVYGIDRNQISANDTSGLLTVACDLAIPGAYGAVLTDIQRDAGHIDIVANVAGMGQSTPALDADPYVYRRVMQVNFFAAVEGTLHQLSEMVERRRGIVLNVSSDSVRIPIAGESPYVASKGALSAFTESVALEVRRHGVSVHVLYPGFVADTAMGRQALSAGMKAPPRSVRRTAKEVSAKTLDHLGGPAVEINAAPIAKLGQILRIISPGGFKRLAHVR